MHLLDLERCLLFIYLFFKNAQYLPKMFLHVVYTLLRKFKEFFFKSCHYIITVPLTRGQTFIYKTMGYSQLNHHNAYGFWKREKHKFGWVERWVGTLRSCRRGKHDNTLYEKDLNKANIEHSYHFPSFLWWRYLQSTLWSFEI